MYNNSLVGKFSPRFGNLTSLENFDASLNYLHGDSSELQSLTNLVTKQLFEIKFSGKVPAEFGEFKKMVNLSLYMNELTDVLPLKLGSWAEFNYIDVSENFLTGPIPPEMCNRGTMKQLLMLQNRFTGGIPASYGDCTSLTRFRVSNNSLLCVVPRGVWGLPNVVLIDINAFNQFEGPITSDIENAKSLAQLLVSSNYLQGPLLVPSSSLTHFLISHNKRTGEIPSSICNSSSLQSLVLSNNNLKDVIPHCLGNVSNDLEVLDLWRNSFHGIIPTTFANGSKLRCLNLNGNHLRGPVPQSLANCKGK